MSDILPTGLPVDLPLLGARIPDDVVVIQSGRLSDGRGRLRVLVAAPAVPEPLLITLRRQLKVMQRGIRGRQVIGEIEQQADGFTWNYSDESAARRYEPTMADRLVHEGCVGVVRLMLTMRRGPRRNPSLAALARVYGYRADLTWLHVVRPYQDGGHWVYPLPAELMPTPAELTGLRLEMADPDVGMLVGVTHDGLALSLADGFDSRSGPMDVGAQHRQFCGCYNEIVGPHKLPPAAIVTPAYPLPTGDVT